MFIVVEFGVHGQSEYLWCFDCGYWCVVYVKVQCDVILSRVWSEECRCGFVRV